MTRGKRPRARCSECGREVAIKVDGTAGRHISMGEDHDFWDCPGAGHPPAAGPHDELSGIRWAFNEGLKW